MSRLFGAVTLLIALFVTPGLFFYFDVTPKLAILLLGAAAACAGVASFRGRPGTDRASGAYRVFTLMLLAAAVSLALSTAFSRNPALSAFGTNWRRFGAVSQIAILAFAWLAARHCAGRQDRIRSILRWMTPTAALAATYGILQYFGWDPLLPASAYHIGEGVWTIVRPPGTMGYVSYFATWLLGAAFLCGALASLEPRGWRRSAALASGALAICAMLLTGTRAAMFGLLAGVLVWMRSRPSIPRRAAGAAMLCALAGAAFYFSPMGLQLRSRTRWFQEDRWGGARLWLWRDGARMAEDRLPAGYGPEVFTAEFPRFESQELARAYPDFVHESPHNIFLDALIAQGVPGLLILIALSGLGPWCARRSAPLAAALAAIVTAQQFTVFVLPTAFLFYLALAIAVASDSAPVETPLPVSMRSATAVAAVLFACCAIRYSAADRYLALTANALARRDPDSAATFYSRYEGIRFPGTSAALWYSRALFSLAGATTDPIRKVQALAQSGLAALQATRQAEDPCNAWYNAAILYATRNDLPRTESALRSAIHAHPRWFKPHWMLARLLALSGREREAQGEAAIASELNGGRNPEVEATLRTIRAGSAEP